MTTKRPASKTETKEAKSETTSEDTRTRKPEEETGVRVISGGEVHWFQGGRHAKRETR